MKLTVTIHSRVQAKINERILRDFLIIAARQVKIKGKGVVSLVLVSAAFSRRLSRWYRSKDTIANVLSFPTEERSHDGSGEQSDFGDILICYSKAVQEARQNQWELDYAIARLALHGFLHLVGYDHEDERDAARMERLERRLLKYAKESK